MKILVTGAAGFIGSNLIERLLSDNHDVVALDNFDNFYDRFYKEENIEGFRTEIPFYNVDIRQSKDLKKVIKTERPERIIHLAARAGVRQSFANPYIYHAVNTGGTLNLLEALRDNPVEQFIMASTSSIYGLNRKTPFSEKDNVERQIAPYAVSKRAAELYCYNYHEVFGHKTTILRLFTVYGPRQRPDMAIRKFCNKIANGEPIETYGYDDSSRDYTNILDIVDGFCRALKQPYDHEIINLGHHSPIKLNYLISLLEKEIGRKAKIKKLPLQQGEMKVTFADISKAQRLLGFDPKVSIEEGVRHFVEWFKESNENRTAVL